MGVDTLVLGCTHFPVLAPLIQQAIGENVQLINSADETASDVAHTLQRRGHLRQEGTGTLRFYTTGDDIDDFKGLARRVMRMDDIDVTHIDLP